MMGAALGFVLPAALALGAPALFAWWRWGRPSGGRWFGLVALLLLVLAAAQPELAWGRGGSDVVLVLDRSASMAAARGRQEELLRLVGDQRRAGDRLAVVMLGEGACVAQGPQRTDLPSLADHPMGDGASDLAAALEQAGALFAPGRTGRVILHSDGEATGADPRRAAARLALAGIPLDALTERRAPLPDAAILDLELPQELRLGESFLAAVRFLGDRDEHRAYRILRAAQPGAPERVLASGEVALTAGRPVAVTFADRPVRAGLASYRVELDEREDRQPLNNRATGSLRVDGGERVLVMGGDGAPGNVARALESAGMAVTSRAEGPLRLDDLLGVSVLVLEQVPADRLGAPGLEAIARWVEHLGGGLVLTGGRRGFGCGGYHKSPVERVLPVTMELRDEHRKLAVAMAISMDRSGSMGVPVPGGRTKMDLADEGAVAAIELLGPHDLVAVHAVDSEPHVVIPLQSVSDAKGLVGRVLGVHSEGGGIYVYQALLGAGKELLNAKTGTRHLVLFADANDAEEPGDYKRLVADYVAAGITVSVVAMGSPKDSDAAFLEDVARRGNGRIAFAETPEDIPRMFAQETVLVARSSWIGDPVALKPQPGLALALGPDALPADGWPTVPGYNLTYARERAQVLALAPGDPVAPAVAVWRIGSGRSAALCLNADDPQDPRLLAWGGYGRLLAGLVRWTGGRDSATPGTLSAERSGRQVTVHLELDPAQRARWPEKTPELVLAQSGEVGEPRRLAMDAVDAGRYEATFALESDQALLPAVTIDSSAIVGPALSLPYSPEAEPRWGRATGAEVMAGLARDTGGKVRNDTLDAYANPPSPGERTGAATALVIAALVFALLEIAVRRLQLGLPQVTVPKWRLKMPRFARKKAAGAVVAATGASNSVAPAVAGQPTASPPPSTSPPPPSAPPSGDGLHEALRQMRDKRKY